MPDKFSKIHPDLLQAAKKTPSFTFSRRNIWFIRWLMSWMPAPRTPANVRIENIYLPGKHGQADLRLRVYRSAPKYEPTPALLWLHGGGYVIGRPEMDDRVCIQYTLELGISVVSVDYRLSPEHPFPAGLEDGYTSLEWMVSHAQQMGLDSKRIAIGGASAGGGLAAALVQLAVDRKQINPIFQLLVYPMLDDRSVMRTNTNESSYPVWNQKSNRFGWESYLGQECGAEDVPIYSVPARRADLSGLPPAWIGVGTEDLFHDEDAAYARRLQEQGVDCEFHPVAGAFHGFEIFDPQIPIIRDFRRSKLLALKKNLCP